VRQALEFPPGALDPFTSGIKRPVVDIPISRSEFSFGKSRTTDLRPVRFYAFGVICLSESSPYALNRVHTIRHLLISASVHNDDSGFALYSQDERPSRSSQPFHQTGRIAFEGRPGLNILADIDHGEESSPHHSRNFCDASEFAGLPAWLRSTPESQTLDLRSFSWHRSDSI
jgi:hypothetical protein